MKNPGSPLTPSSSGSFSPLAPNGAGVLWLQVSALAGVQGAITLTWIIYRLYLPQLLALFGFPGALAATLLVVENLLGAVMEPLMGGLSDQAKRWMGTRFPFISGGVILSSTLFIAIPTLVVFGNPTSAIRSVLPILLIGWALAMTVFRSPAISLLGQYAAPTALPLAASLLTLTGGTIGAFAPFANRIVLGWGPVLTFAVGSFTLLGAAAVLRFVHPPETPTSSIPNSEPSPIPAHNSLLPALGWIFVTGASVAWGSSFLMQTMRKVMQALVGNDNLDWVMFVIAIAFALAALPAGAIATKLGNGRAMLWGIGVTMGFMLLIALIPNWLVVLIAVVALVAAFSLIVNGAVPYALSLMPPQRAGLGTGMYFGGYSIAAGLFGMVFTQVRQMAPITAGVCGAIAFFVAGLCIAASISKSVTTT